MMGGCLHCLSLDGVLLKGRVPLCCADMPEEVALRVEEVGKARLGDMSQALCLNTEVSTSS